MTGRVRSSGRGLIVLLVVAAACSPAHRAARTKPRSPGVGAAPCTADDLRPSVDFSEPAGSTSLVTGITLTNTGAASCRIGGFPTRVAATDSGLPTVVADHTRLKQDLPPGGLAPGRAGLLVVYSPLCGDDTTTTAGARRIYHRLVITLPGGGQVVARTALDLSCSGFSVDPLGVRDVHDVPVPSRATPTASATSSARLLPLFLGHGIGVVEGPDSRGCSDVFLSTDFSRWRDVTPQMSSSSSEQECPYWNSASFVSPQDGWVLGRGGGATDTVLFHTVDAGHTWTQEPGGKTGSNAGNEVIGFANPQVGWRQQFATGANRPYTLEISADAGTTWSAIGPTIEHGGCEQAPVVFANRRVGLAAFPLTYDYPSNNFAPAPWVWQTVDGGMTWKHLTVPAPQPFAGTGSFYGSPSFFGTVGVLPVAFAHGSRTVVGFYASDDSGLTWSQRAVTPTQSALFPTAGGDGFCANPTHAAGSFPVVAIATPKTWWVVGTSRNGTRTISVTRDGGHSWRTVSPIGLPRYTPTIQEYASLEGFISSLRASSDTRAWITVTEGKTIGSQTDVLLQTGDGGRTWSRVKLGGR